MYFKHKNLNLKSCTVNGRIELKYGTANSIEKRQNAGALQERISQREIFQVLQVGLANVN
jgi:hypothetical protein